jgi:hypothetical protein
MLVDAQVLSMKPDAPDRVQLGRRTVLPSQCQKGPGRGNVQGLFAFAATSLLGGDL